mmetsp:Transcript_37139/g.94907  ORF Transcript_37139/g.94907 Transcript_37139/m.94907 type:complete len:208 (-) Transcript_37139:104-727(-)
MVRRLRQQRLPCRLRARESNILREPLLPNFPKVAVRPLRRLHGRLQAAHTGVTAKRQRHGTPRTAASCRERPPSCFQPQHVPDERQRCARPRQRGQGEHHQPYGAILLHKDGREVRRYHVAKVGHDAVQCHTQASASCREHLHLPHVVDSQRGGVPPLCQEGDPSKCSAPARALHPQQRRPCGDCQHLHPAQRGETPQAVDDEQPNE